MMRKGMNIEKVVFYKICKENRFNEIDFLMWVRESGSMFS